MINSDYVYDLVRRNFVNYFPRLTYKEYETKIYDAINKCGDKNGFITYSNAKYYSKSMYDFTQSFF